MSNELITSDKQAMSALKQHGGNIVTAILAVLAIYFGWQFYQKNYAKIDTAAADSYVNIASQAQNLTQADTINDKDKTALFGSIDTLATTHSDTVYAWQALMTKARMQSDSNDYKGAIETLNKAIAIPIDDKGLIAISRLQLASVQLADNQMDNALNTLKAELPKSFEASRLEIEGDIFIAKKDNDKAKESYQKAWELLTERHENRALLGLKLQALGITPTPIEPKHAIVANN